MEATATLYDGTKVRGRLTTDHAASSYGQPVFVDDAGQAYDWFTVTDISTPSEERKMHKVNYSPLKREACPWRYAAEGASETCGGLTAARREMFTAAMWSASPECPQATQEKVS